MKTVLAVLGVLALVAVILIGGGGYYAYKKATTAVAEAAQLEVQKFIASKRPPQEVADTLNRLVNASKMTKPWLSAMLMSFVMGSLQDGAVTPEERQMLTDAAALAEKGEGASKAELSAFMEKYQKAISQNYSKTPGR